MYDHLSLVKNIYSKSDHYTLQIDIRGAYIAQFFQFIIAA